MKSRLLDSLFSITFFSCFRSFTEAQLVTELKCSFSKQLEKVSKLASCQLCVFAVERATTVWL